MKKAKVKSKSAVEAKSVVATSENNGGADLTVKPNIDEISIAKSVEKEIEARNKRVSIITKLSAVWTLISTVYAIASTCLFIAKGWLSNALSIVLVCILAVYVIVFIVLAVVTFKDFKGGKKKVKVYKKTLKIFKAAANIILLSITAVSMVGISIVGITAVAQFIAFILTFVVAVVQLGLNVTLLVMKLIRVQISKKFKVEFVKFVDGKKKKKSVSQKIKEKQYKDD